MSRHRTKNDRELGMHRPISRRDFVQGSGLAALGLMLPSGCGPKSEGDGPAFGGGTYPPTRTGMRGSHPGSFETAHALAREGRRFDNPTDLDEHYNLVVVGAGISGLAAAYSYRKQFGPDSRILLLDNHDDFGGHAKRNEFHQGGEMRLSWGGTMNLEYQRFSDAVLAFLADLGVDPERLAKGLDFHYGGDKPSIWFDEQTYGQNVLVPGFSMWNDDPNVVDKIDQFPINQEGRAALKQFYISTRNVLQGMSPEKAEAVLHGTSYTDFLSQYAGLPDEVVELFVKATDGYWGVQTHSLSVAEALYAWLPGARMLGEYADRVQGSEESEEVAMFPDGNASIARLIVRSLIPGVAAGQGMDDVAKAQFDYSKLDRSDSPVRLRLESTAVQVINTDGQVAVTYVKDGQTLRLQASHCILACYHAMIPHLCPEMSEAQKEAQRYQVKHPMLLTNVLLRDNKAMNKLGISGAYCPGRMHARLWLVKGVSTGGYQHAMDDDGPVPVMFWGTMAPPSRDVPLHDQLRGARAVLLQLTFEDFEREVRTVLDGMLGPAGFDVQKDILAITVNRWPHGYSYEYLDLWDPDWPPGQAPHEIARQRFGNIAIANSDAGPQAYTHTAIEQALRAVRELSA